MPTAEIAPAPTQAELITERFPHLSVPGFDKLAPDRQEFFSAIPPEKFSLVRLALEKEIAKISKASEVASDGEAEQFQAGSIESTAIPRKEQANTAIETFHRAEQGDPEAKKDLLDQKRELLNEEPSDDDIFQTILESQSSNPFAQDLTLEVMLSDEEAQAHQDVLDLFKDFRGDMPSVDDAIKPELQIAFFLELTKGGGQLPERMFFVRKALTVLTASGQRTLSEGLKELHVLNGGAILESGVDKLKNLAGSSDVTPDYA